MLLQELPKILFGKNDGLDHFTQRNSLMSAARSDFAITVLDVELILAQQPFAQVAVDLIHTLSEFVSGDIAEVGNLRA